MTITMEEEVLTRITALEIGLKQSNLDRNRQMAHIHLRMQNLATKKDIKAVGDSVAEIAAITRNLKIGVHVGGRVLGFSGKTVVMLGGFFIAWAAFAGGIKSFLTFLGLKWIITLFANVRL